MVDVIAESAASSGIPNWFAVVMGVGTVFIGLIAIIIICKIVGWLCSAKKEAPQEPQQQIENKREIIAAITAAIAESSGKDINTIKVISFKKL